MKFDQGITAPTGSHEEDPEIIEELSLCAQSVLDPHLG